MVLVSADDFRNNSLQRQDGSTAVILLKYVSASDASQRKYPSPTTEFSVTRFLNP